MIRVLITGFGPFPGAPYNPTGPLASRLAKLRLPALAGVERRAHVFRTSYAAVDAELPGLIASFKPHALLMFGVATRRRDICIETRAQNAIAAMPDASGKRTTRLRIEAGSSARAMPLPAQHLLAAARATKLPLRLSRDAGRYLCNYLCWRATEEAAQGGGPRLAVFVHVPAVRRGPARRGQRRKQLTLDDLAHAGSRILAALATAAKRR